MSVHKKEEFEYMGVSYAGEQHITTVFPPPGEGWVKEIQSFNFEDSTGTVVWKRPKKKYLTEQV